MIIVYLKGGLGNQLFQYAAGRHLAQIHGTDLKMDISAYDYDGPYRCFLQPFNVKTCFASAGEIEKLTTIKQSEFQKWFYSLFHNHPKLPKTFVRWNRSHFNPDILKLPDNVYLEGYFCSEKYFIDIESIIRSEFVIKTPQTGRNKELAELIALAESVSFHIRRGDYVLDAKTNRSHGTCDLNYYHDCINKLTQRVKKPHFFIFSDDPSWCRRYIQLSYPVTYVDHNSPQNSHEDLRLMASCKHNIIANSTFSWWGGWLNTNPEKMVFAPNKWFAKKHRKTKDIVPDRWIKA